MFVVKPLYLKGWRVFNFHLTLQYDFTIGEVDMKHDFSFLVDSCSIILDYYRDILNSILYILRDKFCAKRFMSFSLFDTFAQLADHILFYWNFFHVDL